MQNSETFAGKDLRGEERGPRWQRGLGRITAAGVVWWQRALMHVPLLETSTDSAPAECPTIFIKAESEVAR